MKRIGIYFFCVVAIGCVTSSILYWENEKSSEIGVEKALEENTEKETDEPATQTMENVINVSEDISAQARFLVKEEDEYLVIYDQLTMKRYDETTILVEDLPGRLQEQLEDGLFFADEEELYEFLENYSS